MSAVVEALPDADLRNELLTRGVKVGPVTATTRKLYETKLNKMLQVEGEEEASNAVVPPSPPRRPKQTPPRNKRPQNHSPPAATKTPPRPHPPSSAPSTSTSRKSLPVTVLPNLVASSDRSARKSMGISRPVLSPRTPALGNLPPRKLTPGGYHDSDEEEDDDPEQRGTSWVSSSPSPEQPQQPTPPRIFPHREPLAPVTPAYRAQVGKFDNGKPLQYNTFSPQGNAGLLDRQYDDRQPRRDYDRSHEVVGSPLDSSSPAVRFRNELKRDMPKDVGLGYSGPRYQERRMSDEFFDGNVADRWRPYPQDGSYKPAVSFWSRLPTLSPENKSVFLFWLIYNVTLCHYVYYQSSFHSGIHFLFLLRAFSCLICS